MAGIRRRTYRTHDGKESVYWQVSYYDPAGKRHAPQFDKHSRAHAFKVRIEGELLSGVHISADGTSTIAAAADAFLKDFETLVKSGRRERSTLKQYKSHVSNHIRPAAVAQILLTQAQAGHFRAFLDHLSAKGTSDVNAAKIMTTLRMIIGFAAEKGWIKGNPSTAVKVRKETRNIRQIEFPSKAAVRKMIKTAEAMGPREHAFVCLGFFCGLRASELRGLPKSAITKDSVHIMQRADQWSVIGAPKTEKGRRTIPMGTHTAKAVKKWVKLTPHALLFTSGTGKPENYANLYNRFWIDLNRKAGMIKNVDGVEKPLYTMHAMRHVAASLWIEQGYNPKKVQKMLGHATIQMTMDVYGHLWHDMKEEKKIAEAAENSVMATKRRQKKNK